MWGWGINKADIEINKADIETKSSHCIIKIFSRVPQENVSRFLFFFKQALFNTVQDTKHQLCKEKALKSAKPLELINNHPQQTTALPPQLLNRLKLPHSVDSPEVCWQAWREGPRQPGPLPDGQHLGGLCTTV